MIVPGLCLQTGANRITLAQNSTPNPFSGEGRISIEFDNLKLIDFAFSIAHAIPLTQILVIDPTERLPYQSELLIAALRADRRSGSPNAVQQRAYRVDLFSLGCLAEKIGAAGLTSTGTRDRGVLANVDSLVRTLKAFDKTSHGGPLPHAALIAETDRLLAAAGAARPLEFTVEGEWTAEDSPLRHAPHPADDLVADDWGRAYGRELAAYPLPSLRRHKYWVPVGRVDNGYGDRNLVCSCPTIEELAEPAT